MKELCERLQRYETNTEKTFHKLTTNIEEKDGELESLKLDIRSRVDENELMVKTLKEEIKEEMERKDKEIDRLKEELKSNLAEIGKENADVVGKVVI